MDQVFSSFAQLAASSLAARLRAAPDMDNSGGNGESHLPEAVEATIQLTAADEDGETTAHITVSNGPE